MQQPITFDKFIRWALVALAIVTIFFIVKTLSGVLLPFFIAWLFAYLLHPTVKFVQHKLHVPTRALSIKQSVSIGSKVGKRTSIRYREILEKSQFYRHCENGYAESVLCHRPDSECYNLDYRIVHHLIIYVLHITRL